MTSDVATAQLGNGGIDIASYSPTDQATVAGFSSVATQEKAGAGFVRIALNQSKAYFQDARVRQAFLYAVDRKQIVQSVLAGKADVQLSDFSNGARPGRPQRLRQERREGQVAARRGGLGPQPHGEAAVGTRSA